MGDNYSLNYPLSRVRSASVARPTTTPVVFLKRSASTADISKFDPVCSACDRYKPHWSSYSYSSVNPYYYREPSDYWHERYSYWRQYYHDYPNYWSTMYRYPYSYWWRYKSYQFYDTDHRDYINRRNSTPYYDTYKYYDYYIRNTYGYTNPFRTHSVYPRIYEQRPYYYYHYL